MKENEPLAKSELVVQSELAAGMRVGSGERSSGRNIVPCAE